MKKEYLILGLIFALTLSVRLYFAFNSGNFDYDAYFNLRQSQYIMQQGLPDYNDQYSYGGRFYTFLPLFHYVLALFGFVFGLEFTAKLLPNIFAASLSIIVYFISKHITKDEAASLVSAFISGFVPIFFSETINTVSVLTAVVPIMFFLMYNFINIQKGQKYIINYIIFFIILTLLHPSSILFVLAIYFYLMLCKIEKMKITKAELELPIFSIFFWLWANLMVYKKAFLVHGMAVVWQNLPFMLFKQNFEGINIVQALLKIGFIPFLFGLFIIYKGFSGERKKATYFFVSFAFSTAIMLWLKLISLTMGFIFLGVVLAILFSQFYVKLFNYIEKTKLANFKHYFVIGIIVVFLITSVFPSILDTVNRRHIPTDSEISAMKWIEANTPKDSTILTSPEEGHMMVYYAMRKNVVDTNFLLINDLGERMQDINDMYRARFKTLGISLLNKYGVNYIYLSPLTKTLYDVKDIPYNDQECFKEIYSKDGIDIYSSLCVLEG